MSVCENCGNDATELVPVTVYGGPDGPFDEDWCCPCIVDEMAEEPDGPGVVRLEDLVHELSGREMDREFGVDASPRTGSEEER